MRYFLNQGVNNIFYVPKGFVKILNRMWRDMWLFFFSIWKNADNKSDVDRASKELELAMDDQPGNVLMEIVHFAESGGRDLITLGGNISSVIPSRSTFDQLSASDILINAAPYAVPGLTPGPTPPDPGTHTTVELPAYCGPESRQRLQSTADLPFDLSEVRRQVLDEVERTGDFIAQGTANRTLYVRVRTAQGQQRSGSSVEFEVPLYMSSPEVSQIIAGTANEDSVIAAPDKWQHCVVAVGGVCTTLPVWKKEANMEFEGYYIKTAWNFEPDSQTPQLYRGWLDVNIEMTSSSREVPMIEAFNVFPDNLDGCANPGGEKPDEEMLRHARIMVDPRDVLVCDFLSVGDVYGKKLCSSIFVWDGNDVTSLAQAPSGMGISLFESVANELHINEVGGVSFMPVAPGSKNIAYVCGNGVPPILTDVVYNAVAEEFWGNNTAHTCIVAAQGAASCELPVVRNAQI